MQRIGFFIDAYSGYNYRANFFSTTQPLLANQKPLDYSSLGLGVFEFSGAIGLLGMPVFEYEYESPLPQSQFQQNAYEFRENQSFGLERYTLGIDLSPVWRLLLPDNTPRILVVLPSLKVRYWRERTQNSATVVHPSLYLPEVDGFPEEPEQSDIIYEEVGESETFSFKTDYHFFSVTLPLFTTDQEGNDVFGAVRLGLAGWHYQRLYATQFPQLEKPLIYSASTDAIAVTLNSDFMQDTREGFQTSLNFSYGIGDIKSDNQTGALDVLRGTNDVGGYNVPGIQWEIMLAYRFNLFPKSSPVNLSIKPGLDFDGFYTSYDKYEVTSGGSGNSDENGEDESDKYYQRDMLFMPWIKVSLSFF